MSKTNKVNKKALTVLFTVLLFARVDFANAACGTDVGIFCNFISAESFSGGISTVIGYLFTIIGILSLFFIVIGGIKYILSAGNEEKMKSAKDTTYSAVIGFVISLMAYGLLKVLNTILQS